MQTKPLIIGLTGGIGSGKSEVSQRFASLGTHIVDADEMARIVVEPGQPALAEISKHFGAGILKDDGSLKRSKLREIIFSQPQEKLWLEALLHPLINQFIRQHLANATSRYAVLVSPLLLETQQYTLVDRILVIDAGEDLQITRASSRDNNNVEQIKAIMKTQLSRTERLARADDIIHNHGDLSELDKEVKKLHQFYINLCTQRVGL